MKEKTKNTIVNLENALKHDQNLEDRTKEAVKEALNYIYEAERMNGIINRLRAGESLKYISADLIAFNAKFYREHRWEHINDPEFNDDIRKYFG